MRQALVIAGRETSAFFRSAMAPVVLAGFLLLTGLFFTLFVFGYSQMSLEALKAGRAAGAALNFADGVFQPLAVNVVVLLLFLLPAVTMRLFAEEYRSGRYDLIMTYPVPDHVWIAGKFLSALTVGAALLAGAAAYVIAATALGRPEPGPMLAATLGLVLVTGVCAAWGVFFSTLFAYQVIAYILTFAFLLVLYVVGGLEPHLPGALGRFAAALSLTERFHRLSRGLVDSRDILYFLAWTALGLSAASAALGGRRLAGARRWARWSPVVVLAALLAVVGVIADRHPLTTDWTRNQRYALAPQSLQVLRQLDQDVRAIAFYQRLDPRRKEAEVLLGACAARSPRFRYEVVDPDRELGLVERYGVTVARTIVLEADARRRSLLDPGEGPLVNAVYRLVTAAQPAVYYLVGHGEHRLDSEDRGGYSLLAREIASQGYDLSALLLADEAIVPPRAAVVIVSAPKVDLAPREVAALRRFVQGGGSVLALLDPGTPPSVANWLADYNLGLAGDYLVTAMGGGSAAGADSRVVIVEDSYGPHPITEGMDGLATFFPFAQSLRSLRPTADGVEARVILSTGPRSWSEADSSTIATGRPSFTEGVDRSGPLPLGVAIEIDRSRVFGGEYLSRAPLAPTPTPSGDVLLHELGEESRAARMNAAGATTRASVFSRGGTARLVVIGDSDFAANANLELYGNRDLLLNSLGWLAREHVLVAVRARDRFSQPRVLSAREKDWLGWGCIFGWPLLVGAASATAVVRRRRAG